MELMSFHDLFDVEKAVSQLEDHFHRLVRTDEQTDKSTDKYTDKLTVLVTKDYAQSK